jgi:NAD(P)H dehydrogenase (quinone)
MPLEILEEMNLKQHVLDSAGGPIQRLAASLWLRGKDSQTVAKFIHDHRPKDVVAQWEKVKNAQGLAFIAPVFWCHFPAIMKGWFERVFSYGDAYALTPDGWRGEVKGRVPLLQHEKALVINTTLFSQEDYKAGLETPMKWLIDDWGLRYPGVKKVEHVYFYRVAATDNETRQGYLERAYELGKNFAQ